MCVCVGGWCGGGGRAVCGNGPSQGQTDIPRQPPPSAWGCPFWITAHQPEKRLSSKRKREGSGCGAGAGRAGVRGVVTGGAGSCAPPACHRAGRRCNPEADMRPDALLNGWTGQVTATLIDDAPQERSGVPRSQRWLAPSRPGGARLAASAPASQRNVRLGPTGLRSFPTQWQR